MSLLTRCGGATAQARIACSRSAAQAVLLLTTTGDLLVPEVEVEVNMCDQHADRLREGSRTGRSKVVSKRRL